MGPGNKIDSLTSQNTQRWTVQYITSENIRCMYFKNLALDKLCQIIVGSQIQTWKNFTCKPKMRKNFLKPLLKVSHETNLFLSVIKSKNWQLLGPKKILNKFPFPSDCSLKYCIL